MLGEGRVVCIFPEGTRSLNGEIGEAEPGAGLFALRTGCPVVPVYVSGTNQMLDLRGKLHRAKVTVAFGEPFTVDKKADRDKVGAQMMQAIARTRDTFAGKPARRIRPHWIKKRREGSRA
jgi:1-acyl-sn-glycerol-3-phosphate acyltransferase